MPDGNSTRISANSAVSVGLMITIITATIIVVGSINKATSSIDSAKQEFAGRMDKFDTRLSTIEKNRETWTDGDMFRWAVHLQKENPTLKIPEPEMHTPR